MDGTSMACPIVSGVLGLALSVAPGRRKQEYLDCLYRTARDVSGIDGNAGKFKGCLLSPAKQICVYVFSSLSCDDGRYTFLLQHIDAKAKF
eukprot:5169696-Pleurochrysis_carterae.AAC.1